MDETPTIDAWGINSNDNICGPCPYCRGFHYHSRTGGPLIANCVGMERPGCYVQVYRGKAPEALFTLVRRLKLAKRVSTRSRLRSEIHNLLENRKNNLVPTP